MITKPQTKIRTPSLYFFKFLKTNKIIFIFNALLVLNCTKAGNDSSSTKAAVLVPVQNQGQVGFCWSYAINGLCEEIYQIQTGQQIILSPEFLGYWEVTRYLTQGFADGKSTKLTQNQLLDLFNVYTPNTHSSGVAIGWTPANMLNSKPNYGAGIEQGVTDISADGLALLTSYGLMPQNVWSYKIPTQNDLDVTMSYIRTNFLNFYLNTNSPTTTEDVMSSQVVASGFGGTVPPSSFSFQGQTYTSVDFANNVIGCKASNFHTVTVGSTIDAVTAAFGTIQQITNQGLYVPLGINWDFNQMIPVGGSDNDPAGPITNPFPGVLLTPVSNVNTYNPYNMHEVLISDVQTDPNLGPYLVVQNSWGTGNNLGNGMGYITQSYIQKMLSLEMAWAASQNPPIANYQAQSFSILLPNDDYMASLAPQLAQINTTNTSATNTTPPTVPVTQAAPVPQTQPLPNSSPSVVPTPAPDPSTSSQSDTTDPTTSN